MRRHCTEALRVEEGTVFGFLDMFAGGALSRFAIFALGVGPYITASIILQLLTIVIHALRSCRKKVSKAVRRSSSIPGTVRYCSASSRALRRRCWHVPGVCS